MTYLNAHQGMDIQVVPFYCVINNVTIKIFVKYTYSLMLGIDL